MALQYSTTVRNAKLDAIETAIGESAVLKIFTGSMPVSCALADSGTLLAQMALPTDWMAAAASGSKAKLGDWEDSSANASGNAGYFRIYDSDGSVCHIQGTITATGGGGDMTVDDVAITSGEAFVISTFAITDNNA